MRNLALLLSTSVGFLSLSQEIVWVRLVSFGMQGRPHAFSIVLAAFLVGIALGAIVGRRVCARSTDILRSAAIALFIAASVDLMILYFVQHALLVSPRRMLILVSMITLTAGLKGILFPIVHHLGSQTADDHVGRSVSRIYMGNVLGSTAGPIVTGFWLLDYVSAEFVFAAIGVLTGVLAVVALAKSSASGAIKLLALLPIAFLTVVVTVPPNIVVPVAGGWYNDNVKHLIQNKEGIVHVVAVGPEGGGDYTYGGNAYDGRISVDMSVNSNGLDRAYLMAVLHPKPKRVLVIGLSSGAWTEVVAGMPGVESVDVVEINPGYLELIRSYEKVAPLLKNSKVHIHIDDGRRWLKAHPGETFDLILQNTTFHWRAYATQLLSAEYMREVKSHLNEGGISAMNTTSSLDVYFTAGTVFSHVVRYSNFVYMSDQPLVRRPDAEEVLRSCTLDGQSAFAPELFAENGVAARLLNAPLEPAAEFIASSTQGIQVEAISDLNVVPEFRHGQPPLFGWLSTILPPSPNALPRTR